MPTKRNYIALKRKAETCELSRLVVNLIESVRRGELELEGAASEHYKKLIAHIHMGSPRVYCHETAEAVLQAQRLQTDPVPLIPGTNQLDYARLE